MTVRIPELRAIARRRSLGVLATTLVIAGCARSPALQSQAPSTSAEVSPSTSATPSSGPSQTPLPSLAFEPPPDILPPASVAAVVVDALRIRERPSLSAPVLATAGKGELVYLNSNRGRVAADGVDWYSVWFAAGWRAWPEYPPAQVFIPEDQIPLHVGWAAVASGEQRFLELQPPRCPAGTPVLATLSSITAWERLACFGDRALTVEGTYGCPVPCGGTAVGDFAPQWLAYPSIFTSIREDWRISRSGPAPSLFLHLRPGSGLKPPEGGAVVRVTGHLSDPASTTCTMTWFDLDQGFPVDRTSAQLYCREEFVADSFEVIGTDPDYPG